MSLFPRSASHIHFLFHTQTRRRSSFTAWKFLLYKVWIEIWQPKLFYRHMPDTFRVPLAVRRHKSAIGKSPIISQWALSTGFQFNELIHGPIQDCALRSSETPLPIDLHAGSIH